MPQATNIVLADAQATPVNHTFIPVGRDANGVFWFEDQSQANSIGFWRISVETKRPGNPAAGVSSKDRTFRAKVGLHEPVLETLSNSTVSGIAPAPTVAYVPRSFHEFITPERSVALDKASMVKMAPLLLQNALMIAVIRDQQELSF